MRTKEELIEIMSSMGAAGPDFNRAEIVMDFMSQERTHEERLEITKECMAKILEEIVMEEDEKQKEVLRWTLKNMKTTQNCIEKMIESGASYPAEQVKEELDNLIAEGY